jgi:hypothetical protein
MKIIITESIRKKAVFTYLNKYYGDLEPYETDEFPDYIFYMKDRKVIFEYNKKNGVVFISYDHIWSFLQPFFGLKDEEIQVITKEWVEEHYNLRVTTIRIRIIPPHIMVEEHYNLRVTTINNCFSLRNSWWRNITI